MGSIPFRYFIFILFRFQWVLLFLLFELSFLVKFILYLRECLFFIINSNRIHNALDEFSVESISLAFNSAFDFFLVETLHKRVLLHEWSQSKGFSILQFLTNDNTLNLSWSVNLLIQSFLDGRFYHRCFPERLKIFIHLQLSIMFIHFLRSEVS